jgi:hypothetical protein
MNIVFVFHCLSETITDRLTDNEIMMKEQIYILIPNVCKGIPIFIHCYLKASSNYPTKLDIDHEGIFEYVSSAILIAEISAEKLLNGFTS